MAGIGFELNKILAKQSYASLLQAYGYAAVISSGPWLISIVAQSLLGVALAGLGAKSDLSLFFVSVTYIYCFSIILTGPTQMVLTRYSADLHFSRQDHLIFPSFVRTLA